MNATFESAKNLHDLGFGIVWLRPRDKAPIGKGWQEGPRQTWAQLEKTYAEGMNVGVRLGAASKIGEYFLCCLDQDVNTSDLDELALMYAERDKFLSDFTDKLPPLVGSGSGAHAAHYYMGSPFEFKEIVVAKSSRQVHVTKKRHGKAVEALVHAWSLTLYCRSNRQMVLPPSIHPDSGRQYSWENPSNATDLQLPVLPLKWLDGQNTDAPTKPPSAGVPKDWAARAIAEAELKRRLTKTAYERIAHGATGDRSKEIFFAAQDLLRGGFTEGESCWVLTNTAWGISEKPYEERGNNRPSAVEWVWKYAVLPAKEQGGMSAEEAFEEVDMHSKTGKPLGSLKNLVLLFKRASPIGDKWIARNEFSGVDSYRCVMPWGGRLGHEPNDVDLKLAQVWLSQYHGIECSISNVDAAFVASAMKNSFHPVRDYLRALQWDGVPRASEWLKRYLGALPPGEDEGLLSDVSRKFLLAAVSRIMQPGCKFDYVLILGGKQGIGKSSAVRILAGEEWAGEGKIDVERPVDSALLLRGKWIFEMPECLGLHKKDAESIKAFFSKEVDRGRDPYERRSKDTKRQCVFVGTTNRDDYLTDSTGNRRFWPVEVTQCDFKALAKDRDQIWAEAYWLWESTKEQLWLSPEREAVMGTVQSSKMGEDPWLDAVRELLERDDISQLVVEEKLQMKVLLDQLHVTDDTRHVRRLGEILRQLGYIRFEKKTKGFRARVWVPDPLSTLSS